jgi:tRNA (cytidine/uridine-2'-O-)-methyltransferase
VPRREVNLFSWGQRQARDLGSSVSVVHPGLEEFLKSLPANAPKVFFSKKAGHTIFEHKFVPGTYIIFGQETMGLPDWVLNRYPTETTRIPMYDARVRSLNLANAASIAVYEAIRQLGP